MKELIWPLLYNISSHKIPKIQLNWFDVFCYIFPILEMFGHTMVKYREESSKQFELYLILNEMSKSLGN